MCPNCNTAHLAHRACPNCGMYKGLKTFDASKKLAKKEKKLKAKQNAK